MHNLTVAILAGGKSRRMGENKALIQLGGHPLISHIISRLRTLHPAEIMIITNEPDVYARFGQRIVQDSTPDQGPLGGVYTALSSSRTQYNFIIACDMPLVKPTLVKWLWHACNNYDAIVPQKDNQKQYLHSIIQSRCASRAFDNLQSQRRSMHAFFSEINTQFCDYADFKHIDNDDSFTNINTPDDIHAIRRAFAKKSCQ